MMTKEDKIKQLNEYRDSDNISQSLLKRYLSEKVKKKEKDPISYLIGSLTDAMLTTPDIVDDWYYISELDKYPTDIYRFTIDLFFETGSYKGGAISDYEKELISCFRQKSDLKWKDDTVFKKIAEEAEEYFKEYIKSNGKTIVSQEYYNRCKISSLIVKNHPYTKEYFNVENEDEEILFQHPIYGIIKEDGTEIPVKGLLDALKLNHNEKTFQVIDLKMTEVNLSEWDYIAKKLFYPFQLSFYSFLTKLTYPDYTDKGAVFIVENSLNPGQPRIYKMSHTDYLVGEHGCETISNIKIQDKMYKKSFFIKGWRDAIKRYIEDISGYDDYIYNKGVYTLNIYTNE